MERQRKVGSRALACVLLLLVAGAARAATYSPVMVNILFRHGARAPLDGSLNMDWAAKMGFGNLTGVGMRQHFNLGTRIRSLYPQIFDSSSFSNFDFNLRSSPVFRTIQSAISHLNGLYPPGVTTDSGFGPVVTSDEDLPNFSPLDYSFDQQKATPFGFGAFPVTTDSGDMDFAFRLTESCPNLPPMISSNHKSLDKNYQSLISDLIDTLSSKGLKPQDVFQSDWNLKTIHLLYDALNCEQNYLGANRPGFDDSLYLKMNTAHTIFSLIEYATDEIVRLWTDSISRDLVAGIDAKINGTSKLKYRMWSGHDVNVLPFMMKHNLLTQECVKELYEGKTPKSRCELFPGFASSFIWEVSKRDTDGQYFVRVLFDGEPITFCKDADNADSYYCPFAAFKTRANDLLYLKNFNHVCGNPYLEQSYLRHSSIILMVGIAAATIASMILLVQAFAGYKKAKSRLLI